MLPILQRRTTNVNGQQEDAFMQHFDTLRDDIAQMFNRWPALDRDTGQELTAVYPVDVYEQNNKIVVDAELPGFKKEEIDVSFENDLLHISAEHKTEKKNGKSHIRERRYKRIERQFKLPTSIQDGNIKAKYKDGILHLEMPKSKKAKAAQITIE